jgi:hypothetical protein
MTKRELETEIAVWKGQTQFWKQAYLKAIKHDDRIILAQHKKSLDTEAKQV